MSFRRRLRWYRHITPTFIKNKNLSTRNHTSRNGRKTHAHPSTDRRRASEKPPYYWLLVPSAGLLYKQNTSQGVPVFPFPAVRPHHVAGYYLLLTINNCRRSRSLRLVTYSSVHTRYVWISLAPSSTTLYKHATSR